MVAIKTSLYKEKRAGEHKEKGEPVGRPHHSEFRTALFSLLLLPALLTILFFIRTASRHVRTLECFITMAAAPLFFLFFFFLCFSSSPDWMIRRRQLEAAPAKLAANDVDIDTNARVTRSIHTPPCPLSRTPTRSPVHGHEAASFGHLEQTDIIY